jgi:hypothetical protein
MNQKLNIIEFIRDVSLLEAETKYIAHQCNCVSNKAFGLAKDIFFQYPYSNCYQQRKKQDIPGTINITGDGIKNRYIINMFGQIYPGKPKYPKGALDGYNARQMYFLRCLNEILKIENLESIGFNYGIGCGLAGGDWNIYYNLINNFAQKTDAKVVLYQLNL